MAEHGISLLILHIEETSLTNLTAAGHVMLGHKRNNNFINLNFLKHNQSFRTQAQTINIM